MATYPDCKSLYITMKCSAVSGSPWAGEVWQTGFRLICQGTSQYDKGDGRVTPTSFGVQDSGASRSTTNWNIQQGWTGVTQSGWAITDSDIDSILSAIRGYFMSCANIGSTAYTFTEVKIYPMLAGGGSPFRAGVAACSPIIATPIGTSMNGSGSNAMPPDVALVASWGSSTRGVSGRGRMFMGGLNTVTVASTGLATSAAYGALGAAAAALVTAIRAILSTPTGMRFCPVIYTKTPSKAGLNADTASVISGVRVSDEFDTQRRRDAQRRDVYYSYSVT